MRGGIEPTTFAIAHQVERRHHLGGKFASFFEHRVHRVGIDLLVRGHLLKILADVQQLVQHKLHVTQRGGVAWHGVSPVSQWLGRNLTPD